jgi:hypothetical protein
MRSMEVIGVKGPMKFGRFVHANEELTEFRRNILTPVPTGKRP